MGQITQGFSFQDPQGNPLANGSVTFRLTEDLSDMDSQVCAGRTVTIALDGNGACSVTLWAASDSANQFIPSFLSSTPLWQTTETVYDVTAYEADGGIAWTTQIVATEIQMSNALYPNGVNVQSGSSYTLQASDNGKLVVFTNNSGATASIPSAFSNGWQVGIAYPADAQLTVYSPTVNIDGSTGSVNCPPFEGLQLVSDGTNLWSDGEPVEIPTTGAIGFGAGKLTNGAALFTSPIVGTPVAVVAAYGGITNGGSPITSPLSNTGNLSIEWTDNTWNQFHVNSSNSNDDNYVVVIFCGIPGQVTLS
jgi:hypothetical protein